MRYQSFTENEFRTVIAHQIPPVISIFYYEIRRKFKIDHRQALFYTYRHAHALGLTKGEPGLPGHESRLSFLTKHEQ